MASCDYQFYQLDTQVDNLRKYVKTLFSTRLQERCSTAQGQKQLCNQILSNPLISSAFKKIVQEKLAELNGKEVKT